MKEDLRVITTQSISEMGSRAPNPRNDLETECPFGKKK